MMQSRWFTISALVLILTGCSQSGNTGSSLPQAPLELSQNLQDVYQRSCKNCHANANTGAPVTGDEERWQEILAAGMDTVMNRVMNGYKGMPPAGQCFACTPEELEQLVLYMSRPGADY